MQRYEFKYRLDPDRAIALQRCVGGVLAPDRRGAQYVVRSLYFDTATLAAYHDKLAGLWGRAKLRLRAYGADPGPVFLELKQKRGSLVSKDRLRVPPDLATGRARDILRALRARASLRQTPGVGSALLLPGLRPTVLVRYERTAFEGRGPSRLRITLDRGIVAGSRDTLFPDPSHGLHPVRGTGPVLELKFRGRAPALVRHLIDTFELETEAISKLALGADAAAPLGDPLRMGALSDEALCGLPAALLYHAARRAPT